jgi:hypothetical protein
MSISYQPEPTSIFSLLGGYFWKFAWDNVKKAQKFRDGEIVIASG